MAKGTNKVWELIDKIIPNVQDSYQNYGLRFNGTELVNNNKSLRYYNVTNASTVTLFRKLTY